jgi:membrane protein DedA with SNARE-associated domain
MLGTIIWVIGVLAAIWVIVDVWNSNKKKEMKIIWSVAAVFFNIITAVVYYFLGRK